MTSYRRNKGCRKKRIIAGKEVDRYVDTCKEKINFSLNGDVYSLTKGLLMDDPVITNNGKESLEKTCCVLRNMKYNVL